MPPTDPLPESRPDAKPRVLVIGDVITDVIVRPEGPIVPGSDRRAQISVHPGGSASNQAAWLARFGVPVALAARAGLPENPIAGFEATLDAMERAMPWLGSPIVAEVQERCTFMLDDSENAFVQRVYPVGDVDRDAAMDRVARYLRRHGSIRVG